jgi:phage shock protein A
MEDMQEENAQIADDIPKLEAKIKDLHQQIREAARKTRVIEIHRSADGANVGMKAMVVKLSGDAKAKFEVDHKMSGEQFTRLVLKLA